jgi:hypothetical protein
MIRTVKSMSAWCNQVAPFSERKFCVRTFASSHRFMVQLFRARPFVHSRVSVCSESRFGEEYHAATRGLGSAPRASELRLAATKRVDEALDNTQKGSTRKFYVGELQY